jgi:uridine phosphorylase
LNRKEKNWEQIILEAICGTFIPKEQREVIPEIVIVGLGLPDVFKREITKPLWKSKKIGQFYVGTYGGVPLAVICQSVGSLATEITIRVLTKTRAKIVIGVGLVGGLQKDITVGRAILPTLALRGEGTTSYYASKNVEAIPNHVVQAALEKALASNMDFHKGVVFTTAALIKEDDKFINKLSNDGVIGIECETSALFLISKLYGINAGAVLLVTDNPLLKLIWSDPSIGKKLGACFSQVVKTAYEAARFLSKRQ